jgi:hypothetical protein
LSPKYHHSPAYRMIVEPGDGVQILIQKIWPWLHELAPRLLLVVFKCSSRLLATCEETGHCF